MISNINALILNVIEDMQKGLNVVVFATGELAGLITKLLIANVKDIKIELFEYDGVDRADEEFEIAIVDYDGTPTLYVEPCWHKENKWHSEGYFDFESDVAYVSEDCRQRLIDHIKSRIVVFSTDD